MSLTVDAPRTITRDAYLRLIQSAGFTVRDLAELRFTRDGIHAVVYARDEHGGLLVDDNQLATHDVFVPVVDHPEP